MKRINLVGMKFGMLEVKDYIESGKYKCKCDCGNYTVISYGNLTSGHTKSCGCLKNKNQVNPGDRFGKLTVIEIIPKNINGKKYCVCVCDCGKKKTVRIDVIKKSKSCGCSDLQIKKVKQIIAKVHEKNIYDGVNVPAVKNALECNVQSTNTSGYTGVYYDRSVKLYKAYIYFKGKRYYLGSSVDIDICISLRKEAEKMIFEKFIIWYEELVKVQNKKNNN